MAVFIYLAPWRGFGYVSSTMDVFSRRIVGWRTNTRMQTGFLPGPLEQVPHDRELDGRLVVNSDCGPQYITMRYTDGWSKPARRHPWAAPATRTTVRWPSRQSV